MFEPPPEVKRALFARVLRDQRAARRRAIARRVAGAAVVAVGIALAGGDGAPVAVTPTPPPAGRRPAGGQTSAFEGAVVE